jgi:hypothetical protein
VNALATIVEAALAEHELRLGRCRCGWGLEEFRFDQRGFIAAHRAHQAEQILCALEGEAP